MPELPEVETTVRKFRKWVCGRRIQGFSASWPRQVSPGIAKVRRAIQSRRIERLGRRGKYLVFHLDDDTCLLVHLGMSGRLEWEPACKQPPAHIRAVWDLSGPGRLLFCDARKFGRILHAHRLEDACGHLGLEPLSRRCTPAALTRALQARSRQLKPLLLDQSVVAGLGNIYVDETLHRARLHPLMRASGLSAVQTKKLHGCMQQVLREAIRRAGTSFDWVYPGGRMQTHLRVYGRTGLPCPRCKTPIERILVGQRSTHFCPDCQPGIDHPGR